MDVGPDILQQDGPGLLAPEYIDSMVETIHMNSAGVSKMASQQDVGNLDLETRAFTVTHTEGEKTRTLTKFRDFSST